LSKLKSPQDGNKVGDETKQPVTTTKKRKKISWAQMQKELDGTFGEITR